MRGGLVSREVAEKFVEALRSLEEERDVDALVEIHTDDCDVGNVAVPSTFSGHDGLREVWTNYRDTFGEMRSEFRNVFADEAGHAALEWNTTGEANQRQRRLLRRCEPPRDRRWQGQTLPRVLRSPQHQQSGGFLASQHFSTLRLTPSFVSTAAAPPCQPGLGHTQAEVLTSDSRRLERAEVLTSREAAC
jgi:hypothetical protein